MTTSTNKDVTTWEENYEHKWKIPNWVNAQEDKNFLENQKCLVDTGHTKWELGLELTSDGEIYSFYWKLLQGCESENGLQYNIQFESLQDGKLGSMFMKGGVLKNNGIERSITALPNWASYVNKDRCRPVDLEHDGAVCFFVSLSVMLPVTSIHPFVSQEFSTRFFTQMKNNLAAALNDTSSGDLKIVSSDQNEFLVNKFILKTQCPAFAAMFSSNFSETTTGIVNVTDITGKTMGILLHFFYTGELLSTWHDADTIVEFTYAAGKFQMTEVLEMLDSVLGTTDKKEFSDIQLMNLAHKLSLKNAAARLLTRVKEMISGVENTAQFLALLDNNNVSIQDHADENLLLEASPEDNLVIKGNQEEK